MKTDRELLELAAKAAGISGSWVEALQCFELVEFDNCVNLWNPLTDDGDALRLAVKLQLNVMQGEFSCEVNNERDICVNGLHRQDPYSATRSAIVVAAAAIGETP